MPPNHYSASQLINILKLADKYDHNTALTYAREVLDAMPTTQFSLVMRAHLGRRLEFTQWVARAFRDIVVSPTFDFYSDNDKALLGLDLFALLLETRIKLIQKNAQLCTPVPPPLPSHVFDHPYGGFAGRTRGGPCAGEQAWRVVWMKKIAPALLERPTLRSPDISQMVLQKQGEAEDGCFYQLCQNCVSKIAESLSSFSGRLYNVWDAIIEEGVEKITLERYSLHSLACRHHP